MTVDFISVFCVGTLILNFALYPLVQRAFVFPLYKWKLLSFFSSGEGALWHSDAAWGITDFKIPSYFTHSLHISFQSWLGSLNLSLGSSKGKTTLFLCSPHNHFWFFFCLTTHSFLFICGPLLYDSMFYSLNLPPNTAWYLCYHTSLQCIVPSGKVVGLSCGTQPLPGQSCSLPLNPEYTPLISKSFPTKKIKMCHVKIIHDNRENHIVMNPEEWQQ